MKSNNTKQSTKQKILEMQCYWCPYDKFRWRETCPDEAKCIACKAHICRTDENRNWRPLSQK